MKNLINIFIVAALILGCSSRDQASDTSTQPPYFAWMDTVGANSFPDSQLTFNVCSYGAVGNAVTDNTQSIQSALDAAEAAGGGVVTFAPGMYLTGALFVGNNVNLEIPHGTMLLGSQNLDDYKRIQTRVAGVEMVWPSAMINIIGKQNAAISGSGVIDARGRIFWDKYYEMRKEYNHKGLRWIVDYDCERPRGILVSDCRNVTVRDVVLYRPGFWSLHILYSQHVTVDNLIISNNIEIEGPSTDGIDIDSSSSILVENCNINCNDDNFCLKAGRDADGLRVNRPCEYILIRNCVAGHGDGLLTCGSETSGSIRHVVAHDLKASGTSCGLRFKSTCQRGGIVEDIYMCNVEMNRVRRPIIVDLNWHPTYSNAVLPKGYNFDSLPLHWKKILEPTLGDKGIPKFRNIYFKNISASDAETCIKAIGIEKSTLDDFVFQNVKLHGKNAGLIEFENNWDASGLEITADN